MSVKIKKIVVTGLLLSILFVLSACQPKEDPTQSKGAFIGGTQGVMAKFELFGVVEDGVDSIFNTETFPLEVTLQNKGEYEIQPSDITVTLLGPGRR
jgi:hypothetical protein